MRGLEAHFTNQSNVHAAESSTRTKKATQPSREERGRVEEKNQSPS
jgi:hypothetical protein